MVTPVSRGNSSLSDIQERNQVKEKIVTSKEIEILSQVFGTDVKDILVDYAIQNGLGEDGEVDEEDLIPPRVRQFITNLAIDAENGSEELEKWRHDYVALWDKMTPEEQELTLKLVEELLGEPVDIEGIMNASKTGVTEAKSAAQIKQILDDGGEYSFTLRGEEYTLSKQGDKYVCKDSNGEIVDSSVNFGKPPGWLKIVGLPGMADEDNALYIGTHQGQMGMIEADKMLKGDYDSLGKLLDPDTGTVIWNSGDAPLAQGSFGVCADMSVEDIKEFVKNSGVFSFTAGGEEYRLTHDAASDKYVLEKKNADGEWEIQEGVTVTLNADDGVLEIGGFAGDKSLYIFDNGTKLSMSVGEAGVSAKKLEDKTLVLYNQKRGRDGNQHILNVQKNPSSWSGRDEWMGVEVSKIDSNLKAKDADVTWTETEDYAIAVERKHGPGGPYFNTYIYDKETGERVTRIWGDPHVQEHGDRDTSSFDFKGDSTFILPDGTKICMNTSDWTGNNAGKTVTTGVNICVGESRVEIGVGGNGANDEAEVKQHFDRYEWDATYADAEGTDGKRGYQGYVFALYSNDDSEKMEWAVWDDDMAEWKDVAAGQTDNSVKEGDDVSNQISRDAKDQRDSKIKEINDERQGKVKDAEDADDDTLIGQTKVTEEEARGKAMFDLFDKLAAGDIDSDRVTQYIKEIYAYYDKVPPQPSNVDPGYQINEGWDGAEWGPGGQKNRWGVPSRADSAILPKWREHVLKCATSGGPVDVYSLVMWVLRDSYLETLQDLRFYAKKVQFYNELRKEIREELNTARKHLANEEYPSIKTKEFDPTPDVDDETGEVLVRPPKETYEDIDTKEKAENYIKRLEEDLNSVGDDAQLANVDLQMWMQKQQQTLQLLSNVSKMLHDTAMSIIRKIG